MRHTQNLILFFEDLAVLVRSGTDLNESLGVVANAQADDDLKAVLSDIKNEVQNGKPLSLACAKHEKLFTRYMLGMIKSGEASGLLPDALQGLAEQLGKEQDLGSQITTALIYPCILVFAMLLSLIVIVGLILPKFTSLFESFGAELSLAGRALLSLGNFINNWGSFIGLALVLVSAILWIFRDSLQLRNRLINSATRLPVLGRLMDQIDYARFTSSFASLLESGLTQTQSLDIAANSFSIDKNRAQILALSAQVKEGHPIGEGLAKLDNLDHIFTHSISTSERAGQLPQTLRLLSTRLEKNFSQSAQRFALMVEPILIVAIGALIGLVIYTVFSVLNNISNVPL